MENDTPNATPPTAPAEVGKLLARMEQFQEPVYHLYPKERKQLLAYCRTVEQEKRKLQGALIDFQNEHCDTHCGDGDHVSLCENASKLLLSLSIR